MLKRPVLADADNLTRAVDIDLNAVLSGLIEQRTRAPIVRLSTEAEVAKLLDNSFPAGGDSLEGLAAQIEQAVQEFPRRNTHPGFFGWIAPSGLPTDVFSHAIVAALNENVAGHRTAPVSTTIEKIVLRWLLDLVNFPQQSEGVLLSGGSMANMTAVASAMASRFGVDFRTMGLRDLKLSSNPVVICSREVHFSIRRAVAMLGIGTDNIVTVETDDVFRMRVDKLNEALQQYRNVICVVASAGTTNTGAIDPLSDIAELCGMHGAWLHVDAAYGGGGLISSELKPRYQGIENADSVTMDLHKWFYQALDGSVLLYRDASAARRLFFDEPDYLTVSKEMSPEQSMLFHISPELSRRSRALPVYIAFRHYGLERLGRNVLHNVQCANYLVELIMQEQSLELVVAPQLAILCFRFHPEGLSDEETDRINTAIRDQVQHEGEYLMSPTKVHGRPVLRVCIMNHATRAEHIDGLVDSVMRIGRSLS